MLNLFSNRRVIRNGECARAWIREMPSPPRGTSPTDLAMTLDIERPSGVRYEVEDRWQVAVGDPVSVGSELSVLVDRQNPRRVAIDWDATREIYLEKTAARRKLLSAGVPVPASKLTALSEGRDRAVSMTNGRLPEAPTPVKRRAVPPPVPAPGTEPARAPRPRPRGGRLARTPGATCGSARRRRPHRR